MQESVKAENLRKEVRAIGYGICVLGETKEQAQQLLRELVEENREQVIYYSRSRGRAVLSDGTTLIARSVYQARFNMDGYRLDEVFFGGTVEQHKNFIFTLRVLDLRCAHSKVPPDFRYWPLKDPRKESTYAPYSTI